MKFVQIDNCDSWQTTDKTIRIDYWANANRPRKANGQCGGYGMYSVIKNGKHIGNFPNKRTAVTIAKETP